METNQEGLPTAAKPGEPLPKIDDALDDQKLSVPTAAPVQRNNPQLPQSPSDCIYAFKREMESAGLISKAEVVGDGILHRFHVEGDRDRSKNGWYVLHLDGRPNGRYGCNKRYGKEGFKWAPEAGSVRMSAEERAALASKSAETKAKREAEIEARRVAAVTLANEMLSTAKPATDHHPYLKRKCVKAHAGVMVGNWIKEWVVPDTGEAKRFTTENSLLIPIYVPDPTAPKGGRRLVGLQAIYPKIIEAIGRDKDFIFGAEKIGGFFTIGKPLDVDGVPTMAICEGYSTGASIYEATNVGVIVAFDAGNLEPVAVAFRAKYPAMRFVLAADHDRWTKEPIDNPGVTRARAAKMAIGEPSIGVIPRFSNLDGKPTDFNDMANRETPEAVNARILNAIRDIKDVPEPQPAPAPAIAPAVEPRANLPAPLPVQSPDVEAPEPKGDFDADSSKFFTIMGYDGEELYVYAHMLKQVINFNAAALYYKKTLLQLAKKYWWQRNFPPPDKSHDFINFDNMVEWFLDVAHFKRGIYDPSKVRGRGAWIDDGRIVFHFGNELMVNGQHMDLTSIKSEYVYSRRPRIRYPDQPSMTIADGKRIVEVAKRFRWVNPCSAHLLVGWAALAPLCGALQWRPHAWITAEAGSGKTHIQDKFAKWLTAGVSLYAAGGSTEAGIRQDLKNDAFPVLYDEGEQNTGQETGRIQHVLALARQASTETGALTLKGTVDGSGMSFLIRSMFLLVSVQVGIKNQADHERIAKLVLKPKKEAGNSGLEWRKTKAMLLDLTKDKTLPARLLRRSMELLPTTLKNIEMFAEVAAELLGSQREGDQYGTLMAGYYSLISDREVLRGEAHLLMSGFTWSDYTEEGQIMSASGAKDILLTRKLRLDGGRECQVSELILRSSGQIVPSLDSMKADQADRALQLYGMRVEGDQLLIAKPHREIMATFRDTAHATNPYSELQSTPGATSDRKKSARFAGPSMRYISLPLADLLADTPAVATANSEDVPF